MIRVAFCCHGNICRSTLAESVFTYKVNSLGIGEQFVIDSFATSTEEIGNMPHHGTQQILSRLGISCYGKRARQIRKKDYDEFRVVLPPENIHPPVPWHWTAPIFRRGSMTS